MKKTWGKSIAMVVIVVVAIISVVLVLGGGVLADTRSSAGNDAGTGGENGYARVVIRYRSARDIRAPRFLSAQVNGRVVDEIRALNALVVEVPASQLDAALALFRHDPNILYAEPDGIVQATFTPNDPEYTVHQYGPQIIQADKAWDITKGDPGIIAAVVDTGVDYTHEELMGKVVLGYDFVNDDADPMDDNGHGTHVAGIIAAATNNGVGVASVGYNTRVMAVKVLNASGSGFYSTVAQGITYAVDHGARIINLSLRGTVSSSILEDAVTYAWNKGVLVVAAAGNDGSNMLVYPAAYPHVVAVSATDWNDNRWSLSNYGDYVDLAAPGVGIVSTDWAGGVGPYAARSGTSMAAPHVAAVAALALAVNPNLTNAELESLLTTTADDKGDPGWDPYYGAGRVNAYRAVLAAQEAARNVNGATVGDFVWVDANGNGLQDAGESGLADVIVELHQADGTLLASTTTDANGHYAFTDVPAGDYYLRVVSPAGYVFTRANQGNDDARDSDVNRASGRTATFSLTPGQDASGWDAGLIPTGRVGGVAWLDPNANALRDPNELNTIPGVPMHITGTDVTGASVDATVNTDANGAYVVDGLLPGSYQIEAPHGYGGYVLTSANVVTVTLTAQVRAVMDVNFGYIAPTWVNLLAFVITPSSHSVRLSWQVALNGGEVVPFQVWRAGPDGKWKQLTTEALLPVSDDGRTAQYEFVDEDVRPATTYAYRLEAAGGATFGPWTATTPALSSTRGASSVFLPFLPQR